MKIVKKTKGQIEYISGILKKKATIITSVVFWKIPHDSKKEDICLKIGRHKKADYSPETLDCKNPKSELTLEHEEFENLLRFIEENYEPFRLGVKKYIPIKEEFDDAQVEQLKAIFTTPNKQELLDFVSQNNILPEELILGLQNNNRNMAIKEFEGMLSEDLTEPNWQEWFTKNDWVLGSEFVEIIDEREIDRKNTTDYLMQAYDGFLDIVEIKRPEGGLNFWADKKDHNNYIPSTHLIKAITQVTKYIYEVEREANSAKFLEQTNNIKVIKPRCILIFGRSNDWNTEQTEAYRILNASYHNLTILTYDHVLSRAKRIVGIESESEKKDKDIPF